jgi:hypothetical protein
MAQRLQQKRSSIAGKRPDQSYLEPGELAINTNASDPGVFFEGNDGSIVKAGPTAMSEKAPVSDVGYGNGEAWFDKSNKILNLYDSAIENWTTAISPLYGGAETLLFVGTEFPEATDSLTNDGTARPFASLNRACLEVARRSILQGRSDAPKASKFTIVLLPGTNIARNESGLGKQEFEENFDVVLAGQDLTIDQLRQFNPVEGGIVLPRGTSIIGLDPNKSNIHPTFYPEWSRLTYESDDYTLTPRTAVFHASGNSLINSVTFRDKIGSMSVETISGEDSEIAVLKTLDPHGLVHLEFNEDNTAVVSGDAVYVNYPDLVSRTNKGAETILEGLYWAEPLDENTLRLRRYTDFTVILRSELPDSPSPGTVPQEFLTLSYELKTHHRLSAVKFASNAVLQDYYTKIQFAFSQINFGGAIDDSEVVSPEINIGIELSAVATPAVDDTTNRSALVQNCSLNSNYGLCGLTCDGVLVEGLKSLESYDFNYRSFQNDPEVYEVFYNKHWISLKEATWRGKGLTESEVTKELALQYLIDDVQLENLRFYYRTADDIQFGNNVSSGLTEWDSDTRHYSIHSRNNAQVFSSSQRCTGAAVGFWAKNGGQLKVEGATISFGTDSVRADGFSGINTIGGAKSVNKGHEVIGIRRPSVVASRELEDESNSQFIHLNSQIKSTTSTSITFYRPINTKALLPYSLRKDTVVWVTDITDGAKYKATIDTAELSGDGLTLTVKSTNNEINGKTLDNLSIPFIRRFIDPREPTQRAYYLQVRNTSEDHSAPTSGLVMRFAENQGSHVTPMLEPGRQLDPGENGGWNHLFIVHQSQSYEEGNNPNEVYTWDHTPNRSESYYVSLKLGDSYGPWDLSREYAKGSVATYEKRAFTSDYADVTDTVQVFPTEERSEWGLSKRSEYLQPVGEAYVSTSFTGAADPLFSSYSTDAVYARGIKCKSDSYDEVPVIDYDNGAADFGLKDATNSNFVDMAKVDPNYAHSKQSISRFLTLLGYESAKIDTMLKPQVWSTRDLPIDQFPILDGAGYALTVGNWPVEFNTPSRVQGTSIVWDLPGHLNNSKGLPEYRKSTISKEMRFDSMYSTKWGGYVTVQGQNHLGEVLPTLSNANRRTDDIF